LNSGLEDFEMKYSTSLMSTAIYCGFAGIALAALLTSLPVDPLDPGMAPLGNFVADLGGKLNFIGSAIADTGDLKSNLSSNADEIDSSAKTEPGILGIMGISLVGISVAHRWRKVRLLDVGAALGLLIYLAPFFAMAAAAVGLCGPGPLFLRREAVNAEGRRVRLLHLRTIPAAAAFPSVTFSLAVTFDLPRTVQSGSIWASGSIQKFRRS
jgi:hypothetical protein